MTSVPPAPPPPDSPYGGGPMPGGWSPPPPPRERPRSIALAVRLMYAGAVLQVLGGLSVLLQDRDQVRRQIEDQLRQSGSQVSDTAVNTAVTVSLVVPVVLGVVLAGVWVLMAVFNGRGASWARIMATILGGLNIAFTVVSLGVSSAMSASEGAGSVVLSLIGLALAATILILLWRRESSDYYAAMSTRPGY